LSNATTTVTTTPSPAHLPCWADRFCPTGDICTVRSSDPWKPGYCIPRVNCRADFFCSHAEICWKPAGSMPWDKGVCQPGFRSNAEHISSEHVIV
jgi:hypothetical protein